MHAKTVLILNSLHANILIRHWQDWEWVGLIGYD